MFVADLQSVLEKALFIINLVQVYKSSGSLSGQALKHYCPLAGSQEVDESEEKKAFLLLHQVFYLVSLIINI